MTALTASAIRAVRQRFGDDADAILALRAAHKTVRPFGDGYAVDEQPVDSAELQRMADAVIARGNTMAKRTKQKSAGLGNPSPGKGAGTTDRSDGPGSALAEPIHESCGGRGVRTTEDNPTPHASRSQQGQATPDDAPSLPVEAGQGCAAVGNVAKPETDTGRPPRSSPPQDTIPALCPCGRPRGHGGRCWFIRGMPGPTTKRAQPRGGICAGCAGPRSRSAVGDLCRKCVLAKVRRTSGLPARIAALEARQAAFEAIVRAAVAELLERIDDLTSEGR